MWLKSPDAVNSSEVNVPRAHLQSEASQRKTNMNSHVWNLEKWYWWTYLQSRNRDSDIEDGLVDTVGKGEGGMKE